MMTGLPRSRQSLALIESSLASRSSLPGLSIQSGAIAAHRVRSPPIDFDLHALRAGTTHHFVYRPDAAGAVGWLGSGLAANPSTDLEKVIARIRSQNTGFSANPNGRIIHATIWETMTGRLA
jgi:hypothetical protein